MIDRENELYTYLHDKLIAEFPNLSISGVETLTPEKLPFVYIEEADNYIDETASDMTNVENAVNVVYEVSVFSNKPKAFKSECKKILKVVDEAMEDIFFVRRSKFSFRDENTKFYRYVCRYAGKIPDEYHY